MAEIKKFREDVLVWILLSLLFPDITHLMD